LTTFSSKQGRKDDSDKADMTYLNYQIMISYCKVLEHGAKKYGRDNYKKVDDYERRYLAALVRHALQRISGEVIDKDSGLPHMAHAMANCGFILEKDL